MAGHVTDHLETMNDAADRGDVPEVKRLISELCEWAREVDSEIAAWRAGAAESVATTMAAYNRAMEAERMLRSFRLSKLS